MELYQLRYFLEVARQQHVRNSAETLHVSQPAVTNAIHRMESELGVQLFAQQGRSIRLTPYGKMLYDELMPLYKSFHSLPDRIKNIRLHEKATIRLNVFAAWFIVINAIREFHRIDPDLNFEVMQYEQAELSDITVTTVRHYRSKKRVSENLHVYTEPVYLAVPDIPRFRNKDSILLSEVADMNFIHISHIKNFRSLCDNFLNEAGISPNTVFESDDPGVVRFMICDKMGVGFWPKFTSFGIKQEGILLKKIEKPECSRDIIIEKHNINSDNIHVQVFYEYLTRYIEFYSES
jgi:DNA-binding transcriptional LysR family regulator